MGETIGDLIRDDIPNEGDVTHRKLDDTFRLENKGGKEFSPDFSQPHDVDDLTLAFPAEVVGALMPDYKHIPNEFKHRDNKWVMFQSRWFALGLPAATSVDLKDGIDGAKAFRHLAAIQGSFEPTHQHKMAAVAYLASLWFNDISYN